MACFAAHTNFKFDGTARQIQELDNLHDDLDSLMKYLRDEEPYIYDRLIKGTGECRVFFFGIQDQGSASHIKEPEGSYSILKKAENVE